MEDCEKQCAIKKLMSELAKGDEAIAKGEMYTIEEVDKALEKRILDIESGRAKLTEHDLIEVE